MSATLVRDLDGRWHYRRSLASRVILLTTMAVGLSVAAVAVGAFLTVRQQLQSNLDDSLLNRAHKAASTQIFANVDVPSWTLGAADVRIIYLTSDHTYRTYDSGPEIQLGAPEFDVARGDLEQSVRTVRAGQTDYRVVTVPALTPGQALVLAQSMGRTQDLLARLGVVMLLFGIVGVATAGAAGWMIARNGLRPVRRLTAEVEEIARTEQLEPLPIEGDDEIARLATAFNQMLAALAASRDRQRHLVGDAGHELRTPLTSLRTNLDLLAMAGSELPPDQREELLDDVRAQLDEFTTLINDLVELARDEMPSHVIESVDLAEVVDRALQRVRRRAPTVHFDAVTEPWIVTGEAASLERAVTNLLDNAAKWSPPDGAVTVRLVGGRLIVADEGPGIAEEDLGHVFDRFWRSDESRGMPGSGLGLSIVAQVVERHSGHITAEQAPSGGALFDLQLPGRPGDPDEDPTSEDADSLQA